MTERTRFTSADLDQFLIRGVTADAAAAQIELLRNPPAAIVLERPCRIGDGIIRLGEAEETTLTAEGEAAARAGRVTKFVPASGAATRMFKDVIAAMEDSRRPSDSAAARELFNNLDSFPFAEEVRRRTRIPGAPQSATEERAILRTLLGEMGYSRIPKALIPFHRTAAVRTPFEEHLLEAARYGRASDGRVGIHFTVAEEFRDDFENHLAAIAPQIERLRECSLDVTFSVQHPSTDTLAIDAAGEPFRKGDGTLLFRPGGHGALLHNLGAIEGDIVSIKNIDNVLPDEASNEVVRWKQILIGVLARAQREVFELLAVCSAEDAADAELDRAIELAARFSRQPTFPLGSREEKRKFVTDALDRPLRVCGVVRNEGEPGGAPFWVREADGRRSVQIVEGSQVDLMDRQQVEIFASSTHFNPVDIVCSLRSWRGEAFDLESFVDPRAVFIATKSYEGRELRALERPGLWNGAMAHWNTICVEVPASTFAPVKTVFDLLRPQHQSRG
jgi:hypothetical protein